MATEAPKKDKEVAARRKTLPELLNDDTHQKNFAAMLGKDARSFAQNILTVYNGSTSLQACDPESIIAACAISASINLSILPSLGQSCVVPYKDGDRLVAQWQIMWKGLVQLAQRSERYAKINLAPVYEGQLVKYDEFKGEVILDASKKKSDRIAGYFFYFRLHDGYVHEAYWPVKKCVEHGLRYSKSFQKGTGSKWSEDPEFAKAGNVQKWLSLKTAEQFLTEGSGADGMSRKTAVKNDLNKWGPLETRIKETIALDQAVIDTDGRPKYIDTTAEPGETKKYDTPPTPNGQAPSAIQKLAWAKDAAFKQGVPHEQFDAWLAEQAGTDEVKAEAATVAWKRVAAKEAKAVDVFAVKKPAPAEPEAQEATFDVSGAATSEFNGEPAYAIRDTSDPVVKYFTDSEAVFKAAKAAQKAETKLAVKFTEKESGGKKFPWITQLA